MNVSELRIGNRVYANNVGTHPSNSFAEQKSIESGSDIDNAQWWMPIPLTEEWLVKLGFEDMKYVDYPRKYYAKEATDWLGTKYNFQVLLYTDHRQFTIPVATGLGSGQITYRERKIKYEHELQNAFHALTGTELTTEG